MSNPAVVQVSALGSYGVCIAFGQNAYDMTPTWTRLDDPGAPVWGHKSASPHNTNCLSNWTVDRGRTYELDKTQAGTASLTLQDPNGLFDPTNASSPFYGKINPMLRAKISIQNPANGIFYDIFTGFAESWSWTMDTAESYMVVTVDLVDGFEPLTMAELEVEGTGVTLLEGFSTPTACQDRINGLLDAAGWPDDGLPGPDSYWRNVNTGNVYLQPTTYNPETQILSCIQDTADAEFPGVANVFMNKKGAVTFYGRYPRFQPTLYPDDVNFWQAGDQGANTFGVAKINAITWGMDSTHLINACLSYPTGILQTDVAGQLYTDGSSIGKYGYRSLSLTDLIVAGQPAGGGLSPQPAANANATAFFYASYYVQNYSSPQLRISNLVFTSRPTGDSQTWAFLTGVEIGDIVTVFTSDPGGGGFGKETDGMALSQFFIEGIHYQVAPNTQQIPDITMTLDVSPRAWFTIDPWAS